MYESVPLKTRAKESAIHVFVFSDLILITTKHTEGIRLMRAGKSSSRKDGKEFYRLAEGIGLARILGIEDISGRTGTLDGLHYTHADQRLQSTII